MAEPAADRPADPRRSAKRHCDRPPAHHEGRWPPIEGGLRPDPPTRADPGPFVEDLLVVGRPRIVRGRCPTACRRSASPTNLPPKCDGVLSSEQHCAFTDLSSPNEAINKTLYTRNSAKADPAA